MSTAARVTLSLPTETVRRLDEVATSERRSRSNAAAVLLDRAIAAAGRQRLEEFERMGRERPTDSTAQAAREAARDHLAEHRRLSGLDSIPTDPEEISDK